MPNSQPTSGKLELGVLDQSPIRKGETGADGLRDTVKLAQDTERLGYSRFWVAEHHNTGSFAGTSPEVLIGQIAARTESIKVGSGGIMLTHYSALKVAEQFRVLESFYPGRIELGLGRAPGSDPLTAAALSYPRPQMDVNQFPQQVADLLGFLSGEMKPGHPFADVRAHPGRTPDSAPEVWLLGSSDYSARVAALLGLPFGFADFFGTTSAHGRFVAELYRRDFKPSEYLSEPRVNVTVQALCAPTEDEAHFIATSRNLSKASAFFDEHTAQHSEEGNAARGAGFPSLKSGLLPPEEAAEFPLTERARQYIESMSYIDGDPDQVKEALLKRAAEYGADHVSIVTICFAYEHKRRSYELIANAFGLART